MPDANLNIKEMVRRFLVKEGFEGLFNEDGECACKLDELITCDGDLPIIDCEAGYIVPCEEGSDFNYCIGREKPK